MAVIVRKQRRRPKAVQLEDQDAPIPDEVLQRMPEGLALFHKLRMIQAGKLPPEAVLGKREK